MKIRGTDFVMFHVSDLGRAVKFYRDALGLPLEVCSEEHQWAEFDCGNVTLSLRGGATMTESRTGARLALAVDDLDAAYAELTAKRVWMVAPPEDHGVCRAFEVLDPDGNVLVIHRRADGTFGRHASPS